MKKTRLSIFEKKNCLEYYWIVCDDDDDDDGCGRFSRLCVRAFILKYIQHIQTRIDSQYLLAFSLSLNAIHI